MVGERGFEPSTPCSRSSFRALLKLIESCCLQVLDNERAVASLLRAMAFCGSWRL